MNPNQYMAVEMQSFRAEYEYIHNGKARISTAFKINEKAEICLKLPRNISNPTIFLEIYAEDVHTMVHEIYGEWAGLENGLDRYIFDISAVAHECGLYFMRARISSNATTLYGHKWAGAIYFNDRCELTDLMQLTITNPIYNEPSKIKGGVIYHVFVDRFCKGGPREIPDGAKIIPGSWSVMPEYPEYPGANLYNNTFWGGTLWGVIEKLDYIKSLGATAIYLSPIFKAFSNHKYDTADYMTVDPIFGGEPAFKSLIEACKEKGIEIILDGVFNHTGSDSIYFNRYGRYKELGAYQSKKSKYYDWYDFQTYPSKYTSWWGIDTLPRINPDNPKCGEYFVGEGGVIDKYSKMGIYGFRLDVADELSDAFIAKIKNRLSSNNSDNILYGEVWEDASNKSSYGCRRKYYLGNELDGVMNYPIRTGIINYLIGYGYENLAYALTDVTDNAPEHVVHNQMNLLGTHDTERIITVLGNEDMSGKSNHELARAHMRPEVKYRAVSRLICAYTILSTIPGIPTIFYGDEAGLEGYKDPFNRMPYPWGKEDQKLLDHYRRLGIIRRENPVYKTGDFKLNHIDNDMLVFTRSDDENLYVTVVNNSKNDKMISFSNKAYELISNNYNSNFALSPISAHIFKVPKDTYIDLI